MSQGVKEVYLRVIDGTMEAVKADMEKSGADMNSISALDELRNLWQQRLVESQEWDETRPPPESVLPSKEDGGPAVKKPRASKAANKDKDKDKENVKQEREQHRRPVPPSHAAQQIPSMGQMPVPQGHYAPPPMPLAAANMQPIRPGMVQGVGVGGYYAEPPRGGNVVLPGIAAFDRAASGYDDYIQPGQLPNIAAFDQGAPAGNMQGNRLPILPPLARRPDWNQPPG